MQPMKRYMINVNGQSYDVTVEELGGAGAAVRAPAAAAAPVAAAPASPAPAAPAPAAAAPAAAATAATAPAAASGVGAPVKAPMPGTLVSYKVAKGQAVSAGQVILILEAMKMENEIVAPRAGVVAALCCSPGSSVNTGDVLAEIA
jgi:glutaconyl-CoA/methylmalonyl-CoA decarboxylase subunit gamma